jgi:hypothetical protein
LDEGLKNDKFNGSAVSDTCEHWSYLSIPIQATQTGSDARQANPMQAGGLGCPDHFDDSLFNCGEFSFAPPRLLRP